MNDIEKAARLMGYAPLGTNIYGVFEVDKQPENKQPHSASTFNPRTNKADLIDVECAIFGLSIHVGDKSVNITYFFNGDIFGIARYADHPTKFAARAEAVMSVVSQLYDAKFEKDGE